MKIVAMIPARSGSKRLVNKNIMKLCGRPLIAYSIESALRCERISEVFLNSDNQQYLNLGIELGAQPFLRSQNFAKDDTPMNLVVNNFIEVLKEKGKSFDAVIVLCPVYPLRSASDLSKIIQEFERIGGDKPLVGLKEPHTHPFLYYKLDANLRLSPVIEHDQNKYYRRQSYPECYQLTHWALVLPVSSYPFNNTQFITENVYGYKVPDDIKAVDIDTILDFQFAEFLLEKGLYKTAID